MGRMQRTSALALRVPAAWVVPFLAPSREAGGASRRGLSSFRRGSDSDDGQRWPKPPSNAADAYKKGLLKNMGKPVGSAARITRKEKQADYYEVGKTPGGGGDPRQQQHRNQGPIYVPFKENLVGGAGSAMPFDGGAVDPSKMDPRRMQSVPEPSLSFEEQNLRQQMLSSAVLKETTKGRGALLQETAAAVQKQTQYEASQLAEEQKAKARSEAELRKAEAQSKVASEKREEAFKFKGQPTPLLLELRKRLDMSPIPVNEYMQLALAHPQHGYYMRREVLGEKGDFVTAPEVSQLFGELIGIWVVWVWQELGSPKKMQLVELGPGRGTMMQDILRAVSRFRPLVAGLSVEMVETSPTLRETQRKKLARGSTEGAREAHNDGTGVVIRWRDSLADVPVDKDVPSVILAQEFFDCMPVKQFQYTELGWCERMVEIDTSKNGPHHLRYVLSKGPTPSGQVLLNSELVPKMPTKPELNEGVEVSAEAFQMAQEIGRRVSVTGGAALVIDYGNDGPSADSMQALKKHKKVHVLEDPGECDVTAHVDFSAIKKAALDGSTEDATLAAAQAAIAALGSSQSPADRKSAHEAAVSAAEQMKKTSKLSLAAYGPTTQCDFLHALGIRERAGTLLEVANEKQAQRLEEEYKRLCSPDEMGTLFKVLAILPASIRGDQIAGFPPVDSTVADKTQGTEESPPADQAPGSVSEPPPGMTTDCGAAARKLAQAYTQSQEKGGN